MGFVRHKVVRFATLFSQVRYHCFLQKLRFVLPQILQRQLFRVNALLATSTRMHIDLL